MANNQLANCSDCGKLYVRTIRDICPDCHAHIEKQYEAVHQYLRKQENRRANMTQVSEDTGVSVRQISKFIIQNRISLADFPNMGYPCQSCGGMSKDGTLCKACQKEKVDILQKLKSTDIPSSASTSREVNWTYRSSHRRDTNEN